LSERTNERRWGEALALGGQVLGLTGTWLTRQGLGNSPQQVAVSNGGWVAGGLVGWGLALQSEDFTSQSEAAWALGGSLGGLLATSLLGPRIELQGVDPALLASAVALGGWTGGFGLHAVRPDHDEAAGGGMMIGLGLGYGAGLALANAVDPTGRDLGLAWSGFGLGTAFGLGAGLSVPGLDDEVVEALMLGGGWAGLASLVAARDVLDMRRGDLPLVGLGAGWGLWQGLAVCSLAQADAARPFWGATLLGSATGAGLALAATPFVDVPSAQVGRASAGGALGGLIGAGAGLLVPEVNERGVTGAALAGSWAGLLLKGLYVPKAHFSTADALAIPAGGAWGLLQGHLVAEAVQVADQRAEGARLLGLGLGLAAGEAFARALDLQVAHLLLTEVSGYAGTGLGAGLMLLDDDSADGRVALGAALGGWATQIGAGLLADSLEYRSDDTWEYLFGQGFGLWQGLGFAAWADTSGRQAGGAALVGMAGGWFLPLAANQLVDYSAWEDLLIGGAAMWGTWLGGWAPYAFGGDGDASLLGALVAGDAGLLLAAVALSPAVAVPSSTLGWCEVGGLGGLALGVSGTAIFSDDNRAIATGMLIGSGVGLVAGAVAGPWLSAGSSAKESASGAASGTPAAASGTAAAGLPRLGEVTLQPLTAVLPPPAGRSDAGPAWVMGVQGAW